MKLQETYEVKFQSDGTDTLTFDVADPPLSVNTAKKEPSDVIDAYFTPVSRVPASPFLKDCSLSGSEVTATFSGELPTVDISQQPAVYSLRITLVF